MMDPYSKGERISKDVFMKNNDDDLFKRMISKHIYIC
jgi:hypothetical protein